MSGTYFADPADVELAEEQPAIRCRHDGASTAAGGGDVVLSDHAAVRPHAADLVGGVFREPEILLGAGHHAAQACASPPTRAT